MQTIIISTDAGYLPEHKFGSWAAYIKTPNKIIQQSGVIRNRETLNGSTAAERMGIANALFIVSHQYDLSQYRLKLYCDNADALKKPAPLIPSKTKGREKRLALIAWYETYIEKYLKLAQEVELEHVKGHLPVRQWDNISQKHRMNRWCDHETRRLKRAFLKEIRANEANQSKAN